MITIGRGQLWHMKMLAQMAIAGLTDGAGEVPIPLCDAECDGDKVADAVDTLNELVKCLEKLGA